MRMFARLWLITIFVVLTACGGGGGGGGGGDNGPPAPSPPSGLSYPTPQTFMVGTAIIALAPTFNGTVTAFSVSPALPAGLSLSTTTGLITGTPTAPAAAASYTVTASNSAGSVTANVSITVTTTAPVITYPQTQLTLTTGVAVTLSPVSTGGAVTQWSISPQLPAGLTFDATNGTIGGAAIATSDSAQYRVRAQNLAGSSSFDLTIQISSGVLLELGHASIIKSLRHAPGRILSVDDDGYWALWNTNTTDRVTGGDLSCARACNPGAELAGDTVVTEIAGGLQVRAATDGRILSTITTAANWWKLASDGTYVVAGNTTALTAWSRAGAVLFTRAGDYSGAKVYATGTELRVAAGAAGANVIEKVVVATGAISTTPAFQGTFHSWFADGEQFLSNVGNTVWVYSHGGRQNDVRAMPGINGLAGTGPWFWTIEGGGRINIFAVGASASPAASFLFSYVVKPVVSGLTLGVVGNRLDSFGIIDLSGATPTKVEVTFPLLAPTAFAARTDSGWLIGNRDGIVVDATRSPSPLIFFSHGSARSIAAGPSRIAVATAAGPILYFDAVTRERQGQVVLRSKQIRLSSDGTVLAAAGNSHVHSWLSDDSVKIFALPSGTELHTLPDTGEGPLDIALSLSGQRYAEVNGTAATGYSQEVMAVGSGAQILTNTFTSPSEINPTPLAPRLSPGDTLIAASDRPRRHDTTTNLFSNATLVGAVSGWAAGWIDDQQLLLHRYTADAFGNPTYTTSVIASPTGTVLRSVVLPEILEFQTVSTDRIYVPASNQILSVTDGRTLWSSPNVSRGVGAITGTHVVFAAANTVRIEPY